MEFLDHLLFCFFECLCFHLMLVMMCLFWFFETSFFQSLIEKIFWFILFSFMWMLTRLRDLLLFIFKNSSNKYFFDLVHRKVILLFFFSEFLQRYCISIFLSFVFYYLFWIDLFFLGILILWIFSTKDITMFFGMNLSNNFDCIDV